jgi:hypothetical protein
MPINSRGGNEEVVLSFVGESAREAGLEPSPDELYGVTDALEFSLANQLCNHVREMYGDAAAGRVIAAIDGGRGTSALPAYDIGFAELVSMGAESQDMESIAERLDNELDAQRAGIRSMLGG